MRAVGLTDHGTFAGAIRMLKACRAEGINPILGMEAYQSRNHLCHDKECQPDGRRGNRHVNVIAKNLDGYKNVCTLSQIASLEGIYYDPRIDFALLEKYRKGLIVTSACLSNIVNANLARDNYKEAKKAASVFKDIFQDDYYLEMMYHGIESEYRILPDIQKLGKELDIKIICTNDCHYVKKEDAEYQEVLMCMSSRRYLKDPRRIHFPYSEFYFKSAQEMYKIFGHVPKYMSNTIEIAEKVDYSDLIFVEDGGEMRLPPFEIPEGFNNPFEYMVHLAKQGLKRLGLEKSKEHLERLKRELSDIRLFYDTKRYDFTTYLLIVHDIMDFAKRRGISAGIRGSGYGSFLLRCLGITEGVDPISQGLLFERFLGKDYLYFLSETDFGIKPKKKDKNKEDNV